jgi:hypothetical protein
MAGDDLGPASLNSAARTGSTIAKPAEAKMTIQKPMIASLTSLSMRRKSMPSSQGRTQHG